MTSSHVKTAPVRAVGRLLMYRKAARDLRMPPGPSFRIIHSARMAFRGTRRIIQEGWNAGRIAFRAGRMAR